MKQTKKENKKSLEQKIMELEIRIQILENRNPLCPLPHCPYPINTYPQHPTTGPNPNIYPGDTLPNQYQYNPPDYNTYPKTFC
jgi:hypothetical protein